MLTLGVEVTEGVSAEEGTAPVAYTLGQNYPNPSARATTVELTLPQRERVTLEVYDVTGRRIARLVDSEMGAGTHRVSWDAPGLASGTYLYRIQAGSYSQTLRALLVN